MNTQEVIALISKYNEGTLSTEERAMLDTWYLKYAAESDAELDKKTESAMIKRLRADLPLVAQRTGIKLWPRIIGAAAAVLIIFGTWFYSTNWRRTDQQSNKLAYENSIAPGKQGATLTLANGKKIRLGDAGNGELAEEAGVEITKSAKGQLIYELKKNMAVEGRVNTLSTAKGETYMVILPDKSKVWLNAASSLTYTSSLNVGGRRRVKLDGEAYFEIIKDKAHPFVVLSKGQEVEVLGTHFNVNAYNDEPHITTTLLEGSVKITAAGSKQIIKPGQQAVNNGTFIRVSEANLENVTDWKEGDFFLNHVDFKMAMRKIARWYDVEVIYDVAISDDLESGGWMSRNNNLSTVLKAIEATGLARFRIEGKKVYVFK